MPTAVLERGSRKVDRKVLSISSKRQITIPQKYGYLFLFAWFLCFLIIIIPIFFAKSRRTPLKRYTLPRDVLS